MTPRLWTPPLRPLTPETSVGFDQVAFARDVLLHPFDPWQEFAVIHAGELLPDGRPRFRLVLIIVARQNGKTEIPVVLSLYWLAVDEWPLVLGTSTKLDYAQESWEKAIQIAKGAKVIADRIPTRGGIRRANGEQVLQVMPQWRHLQPAYRAMRPPRYKIAASNEEGGRSLTIDRLVLDELRQHHTYAAYAASEPAVSARPRGQIIALSNAGDDRSIVLNDKRADALAFIKWWNEHGDEQVAGELLAGRRPPGMPNFRIGLLEWSAPDDFDFDRPDLPNDVIMPHLMQANPNAGHPDHGADPDELLAGFHTARATGGEAWSTFKTEQMCIRVVAVDSAIDATAWKRNAAPVDLAGALTAWCVDVAPDMEHATLHAATLTGEHRDIPVERDGKTVIMRMAVVAVDVVQAWSGPTAVRQMTAELPGLAARNRPRVVGWLPGGPAAAAAATLKDRSTKQHRYAWPPPGIEVAEITAEVPALCMGLAADVKADLVQHSDDPLTNAHVLTADKKWKRDGDVWVFERGGESHVNGAYSTAGAVHLARTLPPPILPMGLVSSDDTD